jgi:hypothetical protein
MWPNSLMYVRPVAVSPASWIADHLPADELLVDVGHPPRAVLGEQRGAFARLDLTVINSRP